MAESAPVVTDVNGDGVDEVVAKMYDGTTILDTHGALLYVIGEILPVGRRLSWEATLWG